MRSKKANDNARTDSKDFLFYEINRRFPEVKPWISEGEEDLTFVVMRAPVDWLQSLRPAELTPDIVERVVDFAKWCENQPRRRAAGEDIFSIYIVAFFETLFTEKITRALIPKVSSREELLNGAKYLKAWVGEENYQLALAEFPVKLNRARRTRGKSHR